jgi:O-antigen ligase
MRLALLGFAVVGFLGVNRLYKLAYIGNAFVGSSLIAILFLIFKAVGIKEFIINPERADLINGMRILYINSHLVFNVYLNISLAFCYYYILEFKNLGNGKWKILFYIFSAILFFYFLVISEGRIGITTSICMLIFIIGTNLWKVRKLYFVIFMLLAPIMIGLLLSNHKRMTTAELENDPHYFIWHAATEVAKNQPLMGYGASRAQEVFDVSMDKFAPREYTITCRANNTLNCQSQFLQTYMEFGIIGLVLLVYLILTPFILAENKRRSLTISLIFIIVAQFNTEIVLTVQGFAMIFGFIVLTINVIKDENVDLKHKLDA